MINEIDACLGKLYSYQQKSAKTNFDTKKLYLYPVAGNNLTGVAVQFATQDKKNIHKFKNV